MDGPFHSAPLPARIADQESHPDHIGITEKEARKLGAEDKNDRRLMLMTVGLGAVGAFYGVETSSSPLGAVVVGLCYSFVGATIGMLLAFAINLTRNWR